MELKPTDFIGRSTDRSQAGQYIRRLGASSNRSKGGFETGRSLETAAPDLPDLSRNDVDDLVERIGRTLKSGKASDDVMRKRAVIIADGEKALKKLSAEGADAELTENEAFATEAVIIASGERPTLSIDDGKLDFSDAELGQWDQITRDWQDRIEKVATSVGRINLNGRHVGTGWVCAPGRIMTNRHVLQGVADHDGDNWVMKSGVSISFDAQNDFAITPEIVFGGEPATPQSNVDFAFIDAARRSYPSSGT